MILAENAAAVYGFDLAALAPLAGRDRSRRSPRSPTPLDVIPADATSPAFLRH